MEGNELHDGFARQWKRGLSSVWRIPLAPYVRTYYVHTDIVYSTRIQSLTFTPVRPFAWFTFPLLNIPKYSDASDTFRINVVIRVII
jgi:hypothetical protein